VGLLRRPLRSHGTEGGRGGVKHPFGFLASGLLERLVDQDLCIVVLEATISSRRSSNLS
jgi:hypothetical protein